MWECDFISGWIAGTCGIFVGYPFDTVKVRMQNFNEKNMFGVIKKTYINEGIGGFYRGLLVPLMAAGIYNSAFFGAYAFALRNLEKKTGMEIDEFEELKKFCSEPGHINRWWHLNIGLAGAFGGAFAVIIGTPIELIKTQLQANTEPFKELNRGHISKVVKLIYNANGFRGFYKGFVPLLMRDTPSYAVYMLVYKHLLCSLQGGMAADERPSAKNEILAGGTAGVLSFMTVMPVDVIKTRIQADFVLKPEYTGVKDCFLKCYQNFGARFFWKGTTASVLRAFPANALTFVVYEFCVHFCDRNFFEIFRFK